jgi:DmsE family decaheme c-type cytochrome
MRTLKIVFVTLFCLAPLSPLISTRVAALTARFNNPSTVEAATVPQSKQAKIADVSQFVGSESCAECHGSYVAQNALTVHGKANKPGAPADLRSCEACHGGGKGHVDFYLGIQKLNEAGKENEATALMNDTAKAAAAKMRSFKEMSPADASRTCMQCHAQVKEHTSFRGSKHEAAGLSCVSCHSLHGSPVATMDDRRLFVVAKTEAKLLKKPSEADTCYQCHADVRKAQFQRSTHLIRNENREHQIECSSCHEPHGSIGEKMMRTASVNETCYQCHTEKRGPFLFEHSPVRESCSTCHRAHGSNNLALLNARTPMLCQQCHIQGRHQTVAGKPNTAFTINRSCVTCHSQIHGSNHPSGVNLQR